MDELDSINFDIEVLMALTVSPKLSLVKSKFVEVCSVSRFIMTPEISAT